MCVTTRLAEKFANRYRPAHPFAEGWGAPALADRMDGLLDERHFRVVQSLSGRPLRIVPVDTAG